MRKIIDFSNLKFADLILTNSKFTKRLIARSYGLKSKIVYLGIDASYFKPQKIEKDIDVFFIGKKDRLNGYVLLEKALETLKTRRVKVKIHDGKWISDGELLRTYNRSKIVVNLEHHQPFGLIAMEAMSCEVPVIVLNDSAYRETVVNGVNGFRINNEEKLSKSIMMLLDNKELAAKIGKQARELVLKKWDWKIRIKELNNLFRELL